MATTVGEVRENIALKTGEKRSNLRCSCDEDCLGGSKFITISMATVSVVITAVLFLQIYYGDFQILPHGSVATDSRECSELGAQILKEGGNAVDSAVASAICLAVINPHNTGLDAEGQFMIYNHKQRLPAEVIDFSNRFDKVNEHLPRLVIGLAFIHQQYGKLPWKNLLQPSAELAMKGFLISDALVSAIRHANAYNLYGRLEVGRTLRLPDLANTLASLAEISEKDLSDYVVLDSTPIKSVAEMVSFHSYNVFVPSSPSVGPELMAILRYIEAYNFTHEDLLSPEYNYKLVQEIQSVYLDYNLTAKFHEGTASNVAVIDNDETYVSIVTGMYQPFGSHQMSAGGYLLDIKGSGDEVKGTICSRLPLIVTDGGAVCGRRLVLGASNAALGAQLLSTLLVGATNVSTAIEWPRFDVYGNGTIGLEDHTPLFNDEIVQALEHLGSLMRIQHPYTSCNVVEKRGDLLTSHSDSRGGGRSSQF